MNRWGRRLIVYGLLAVAIVIFYRQMKSQGLPDGDVLMIAGAIAVLSSLFGFLINIPAWPIKRTPKFQEYSEQLGAPMTARGRIIQSSIWLLSGLVLMGAGFLISR